MREAGWSQRKKYIEEASGVKALRQGRMSKNPGGQRVRSGGGGVGGWGVRREADESVAGLVGSVFAQGLVL